MEQLRDMPPFAWAVFAFTLAIIFGVRHLGLLQGEKAAPPASPAAAQVAAVIVDPTALNKATAALEAHTVAVHRLIEAGEDMNRMLERTGTEMDRIREELRIQREVARRP